jgi:imidazolonepropionase-like amidohydrolase
MGHRAIIAMIFANAAVLEDMAVSGACADLIVAEGEPLAVIPVLDGQSEHLSVITKAGVLGKRFD